MFQTPIRQFYTSDNLLIGVSRKKRYRKKPHAIYNCKKAKHVYTAHKLQITCRHRWEGPAAHYGAEYKRLHFHSATGRNGQGIPTPFWSAAWQNQPFKAFWFKKKSDFEIGWSWTSLSYAFGLLSHALQVLAAQLRAGNSHSLKAKLEGFGFWLDQSILKHLVVTAEKVLRWQLQLSVVFYSTAFQHLPDQRCCNCLKRMPSSGPRNYLLSNFS